MTDSVRVDFHCHSTVSDGEWAPEHLARTLAQEGIRFAALTDHDSVAGVAAFREAAAREGMGVITGVEIFADSRDGEVHLLAYGFDAGVPALAQVLAAASQASRPPSIDGTTAPRAPSRRPSVADVAAAVHEAGGLVFLAHPLDAQRDPARLRALVLALREDGLDGIEAIYGPYNEDERQLLVDLASDCGLLISGGSDFHGPQMPRLSGRGVELSRAAWERFRTRLFSAAAERSAAVAPASTARLPKPLRLDWAGFFVRILLPTLLAISLLMVPVYAFIVPAFEDGLMARKREMIRELTNSAWSILAEYYDDEQRGRATRAEAQQAAIARVQYLRYGKEGKDYFWITDMHPRVVMHPYRTDLNGKDVSGFQDPRGNKVFMEFVRVVRERREGYVEYVWQWKDDRSRLAPKQSYVRGFAPWGWVVGTGIYIEDVEAETAALTGKIIRLSVVVAVVIALLLLFVAQQSFRIERQRTVTEDALRESHEKYRSLVQASKEGTMVVLGGRCTFANQTLLGVLGYREAELALLDVDDIVRLGAEWPSATRWLEAAVAEGPACQPAPGSLRRKDGTTASVLLAVDRISLAGKQGYIIIAREAGPQERSERSSPMTELHDPMLALDKPIRGRVRPLPSCALDTPIDRAAALMSREKAGALLVTGPRAEGIGLITDADLRERVVARRLPGDVPVSEIMTAPLPWMPSTALGYQAIQRMDEDHVDHVIVRDELGRPLGLVGNRDLIELSRHPLASLSLAIRNARSPEEVVNHRGEMPAAIRALVDAGVRPRIICGAITAITDVTTQRLIELAIAEAGPPPTPFAFLVFGSQGRAEQTLVTDQDNGIVFDVPEGVDSELAQRYFVRLGGQISRWLDRAGSTFCPGGNMADNPRWCAPLGTWRERFSEWIGVAEPKDQLEFNIFFDLRPVWGQDGLALELRRHVQSELAHGPSFFVHLAQNALHQKPLLGFFGKIVAQPDGGQRTFNIKEALLPIVSFARLYALRAGVTETNTFDRLRRLNELGVLADSSYQEIARGYELLMSLRLHRQSEQLSSGQPATNQVNIRTLGPIHETMLKQVFAEIEALQKRISSDFFGGDWTQRA